MNTNQGKSRENYVAENIMPDNEISKTPKYYIVIVSPNEVLFKALVKTLQNFSLSGKGIQVIRTNNLIEAKAIAQSFPDIVLVLIDDVVQVNGSYKVFVDFMVNELNNKNCKILFMQELIRNNPEPDIDVQNTHSDEEVGFLYARERLIDITRMVLLTTDMEIKISGNVQTQLQDGLDSEPAASKTRFYYT